MTEQNNNNDFLDDFIVKFKGSSGSGDRQILPELTRLPATVKQIKKQN